MPVTDLREQVTAELNQLQDRIALLEGKADGLISRLDHREKTNTPDDHLREIVENKWLDLETRLGKLEERAEINRRLYSELASGLDKLREFFTPIMEDNLIMHHGELIRELQDHLPTQQVMDTMKSYDNRLENLEIAIRQLGSPKVTGGD
jgi:chromosome segregation ATPase